MAVVVSSGFKYLIDPAIAELNICSENVFANRFVYDKEGYLSGIEINVNGNKVKSLEKAIAIFKVEGISENEIAYVGDNNWDIDAIRYILNQRGSIYYLQPKGDESLKMYPLSDETLFSEDKFYFIDNLTDILDRQEIGKNIKAIVYDADGTIINTE